MECQVCLETFNALERRPKVLPCGHTYCLRCLKELPQRNCPTDRKAFTEYPDNLVDNFLILNVSDKLQPSLWCSTCQKEATSKKCLEWHTLCSMKRARKEKATPLLKSLKAAVQEASLRVETMAKVRELVLAHSSRVEQRQEKLLKAQTTLQSVVETEHEDLAKAMADVEQALSESVTPTARPSAKDGGLFRVNLTLSNMVWSANLNLKDAMVDQVCQGLDILTEGQLTWQKIDSPFSSSKSKSASSGHGFSFGGATSSSSGPAPTTSIPSFCFGSSSSGLFGASTALTTSAPSICFGSSSSGLFGASTALTTSAPSICFGSSSSGLFGASTALTTSAPSFGLGSSSSVVLSAPSASGPALTTSTPLFGLRASSTGFFDPSSSTKPTDAKAPSSAGKSQFSFGGTPATGFSLPRLSASSAAAGTPLMSSTASTASSAPTSSSSDSPSAPC